MQLIYCEILQLKKRNKETFFRKLLGLALTLIITASTPAVSFGKEKVGVLFIRTGAGEYYPNSGEWVSAFFNNMWSIFADGFHVGGFIGKPTDQLKCYTQVHYATENEALGCQAAGFSDVAAEDLIDVFCNEYPPMTVVHSIKEYGPVTQGGDGSFSDDCYPNFGRSYAMFSSANHTIDPSTGLNIVGPVLEPEAAFNPGQGFPEFHEIVAWGRFDYHAELPAAYGTWGYDPHRKDYRKFWFGNDADCEGIDPGCGRDTPELANVKDRILASDLTDDFEFVFRYGWEVAIKNLGPTGLPATVPESVETALENFIVVDGVDRILVVHNNSAFYNMTQYGDSWYEKEYRYDPDHGTPVSRVPGKTYLQCIKDLDDDYGPGYTAGTVHDPAERDAYFSEKPEEYRPNNPWPEIVEMVDVIATSNGVEVDLQFAPAYGKYEEADKSVEAMINYTINKFSIPDNGTQSLAVILVDHGYHGVHRDSATCDVGFVEDAVRFDQAHEYLMTKTDLPYRFSKMKVVRGAGEYAEGHYSTSDVPPAKPLPPDSIPEYSWFGNVMSLGEQVDNCTNGTYLNYYGDIIDNGNDRYSYIIAVPYFFEGFSGDFHEKKEALSSMEYHLEAQHSERNGLSPDGDRFGPQDYVGYIPGTDYNETDGEYFVMVNLDGTVFETVHIPSAPAECTCTIGADDCFCSEPMSSNPSICSYTCIAPSGDPPVTVYKGSTTNPTTVIITGPQLTVADADVRTNLVEAVYRSVEEVLTYKTPIISEMPLIRVDPQLVFLNREMTKYGITIHNDGSGSLLWKVGDPEYIFGSERGEDGNWLTPAPSAGLVEESGSVVLMLTVGRSGLDAGLHIARVPITTQNDGRCDVWVVMWVPFFNFENKQTGA